MTKIIPDTLKTLELPYYMYKIPNNILPSQLETLKLHCYRNELPVLPTTLKSLSLGMKFNNNLTNLPLLNELELNKSFNTEIKVLPHTLRKLIFINSTYKFTIDDTLLPEYLEELHLPHSFNQTITSHTFN